MKKIIGLFAFMFLLPAVSRADSCTSLPDCESMGYFLGYNAACGTEDARYIFCPYDIRYRKCVDYDCEGIGFTADDKTEWCETIVPCKMDNTLTLCDEPKGEVCEVVTCPEGVDVNSLIANAIAIDPCTPMGEDCLPGETVYTNWKCRNGYSYIGGRCRRLGFCDEGTYGTLNECRSSCSGNCVALETTDPRYSDVCRYVCDGDVVDSCPSGSYEDWSDCDENCDGTCVESDGCYYCGGGDEPSPGGSCTFPDSDPLCENYVADMGDRIYTPGDGTNPQSGPVGYGSCTTCEHPSTTYHAWTCMYPSHYDAEQNACVYDSCEVEACEGVYIPSYADCSAYESCTPHDNHCVDGSPVQRCKAWECWSGYHVNATGTGCDRNCTVVECHAVDIPENAHGNGSPCVPTASDCSTGTPVYEDWVCDNCYTQHENDPYHCYPIDNYDQCIEAYGG